MCLFSGFVFTDDFFSGDRLWVLFITCFRGFFNEGCGFLLFIRVVSK